MRKASQEIESLYAIVSELQKAAIEGETAAKGPLFERYSQGKRDAYGIVQSLILKRYRIEGLKD